MSKKKSYKDIKDIGLSVWNDVANYRAVTIRERSFAGKIKIDYVVVYFWDFVVVSWRGSSLCGRHSRW